MKLLLALLVTLLVALPTAPAAEQKIGMINLQKVFDDYYKTKAADQILKEKGGRLEKERKGHIDAYQKATDEYKKALDDANNQAISADERDKRKKTAEGKLLEIKEIEGTINQFDRSARTQIDEERLQARDKILAEIRASIAKKAKAAAYTLVIDVAAETINKTPVLMYTDGSNDMTNEILAELNANAPPDLLNTPASLKPAGRKPEDK